MADETAGTTHASGAAKADPMTCLVTGAGGYLNAQPAPEPLDAGYRVRCPLHTPRRLRRPRYPRDAP
ncbi:hypothetical protein [Streptomyces sp. NPDC021562]|uniref:hypothetical protein n=1 Tax=Streptomyces sp. NPDC021562 TaxID=3155121 RepID=UPI0033DCD772